ncbi:MAG: hypothetical protein IKD10_03665 [Lentisphaeria bacterium]|nr:hypothetical protein [Lentisphaeria bacterium]
MVLQDAPPVCRAIDLGRFGKVWEAGKARQQHLAAGKTVIYRYAAIYPIARLPRRSTTVAGVCGERRYRPPTHSTARLLWRSLFFLPFSGGCCYYYAEEYQ